MRGITTKLRRSAAGFLLLPSLIVFGFVLLAEIVDWLDNHAGSKAAWGPLRLWLSQYVGDTQAAIGVLTAIAGSLFTVTSVTFSILLLAVQQGATVLNSQIVDHYLRRRANRAWFGFFVGVSVFVLITLVQTTHTAAPVFGVIVSTLLGATALVALIVLIYSTVNQTRPATVIQAIVAAAIRSREQQLAFLSQTVAPDIPPDGREVCSTSSGYLIEVDLKVLQRILTVEMDARLVVVKPLGSYISAGEVVALVHYPGTLRITDPEVLSALILSEERDLENDPALNVDHIATIGWTAISTAHSDPAVGAVAARALQRLLVEWRQPVQRMGTQGQVLYRDAIHDQLLDAFESLIVAATESRQHQSLALLLETLSSTLATLPPGMQAGIVAMRGTLIAGLKDHLPTRKLTDALGKLVLSFEHLGEAAAAEELRSGLDHLLERAEDSMGKGVAARSS